MRALADIDRLSPGRIEVREYSVERPRFAGYVLAAVVFWLVGGAAASLASGRFERFRDVLSSRGLCRGDDMKGFSGFVLAALVLAAVGRSLHRRLADRRTPRRRARADGHAPVRAGRSRASMRRAGYVGYTDWVPMLGSGFPRRDPCPAGRAPVLAGRVRQRSSRSQAVAAAAEVEPPVDLQLVVANAGYRAGLAQAKDRAATQQALDAAVARYGTSSGPTRGCATRLTTTSSPPGSATTWPRGAGRRFQREARTSILA